MKTYNLKLKEDQMLPFYIKVASIPFNFTKTERELLIKLVECYLALNDWDKYGDMDEKHKWKLVFSSHNRKAIAERLGFTSRVNLDQYIKRLKKKKGIIKDGYLYVPNVLIPTDYGIGFQLIPKQNSL